MARQVCCIWSQKLAHKLISFINQRVKQPCLSNPSLVQQIIGVEVRILLIPFTLSIISHFHREDVVLVFVLLIGVVSVLVLFWTGIQKKIINLCFWLK